MARSDMILLMDELLRHRRHFYAVIDKSRATGPFTDVDYVIARYLQSRLNIPSVSVDDPAIHALFQNPPEPAEPCDARPSAADISPFTTLRLRCPGAPSPADKSPVTGDPALLTLCYGWQGPLGADALQALLDPGVPPIEQAVLPLFGMAPGLWRAASFLIFANAHRPVVMDAIRHLVATFSCDDLDALQLAEKNLELREALDRPQHAGTHQTEINNLRALVATMEAEIVALRRTAVQQEHNLATRER